MVAPPASLVRKVLLLRRTTVVTALTPVLRAQVVVTHRVAPAPAFQITATPPALRRTLQLRVVPLTASRVVPPLVAVARDTAVAVVAVAPVVAVVARATPQERQ